MRGALGLGAFALLGACTGQPVTKSAAVSPPAIGCSPGETPIFSCRFADATRVAVCGTTPGKAEYRFGGDTPEQILHGGARAVAMYSGGGESQLAFADGSTRYIVFSRMVRTGFDAEGNRPAISDGVVVERAGAFQSIRICDDADLKPVDVAAAEAHLPASANGDLFTEETIRADPPGHE